MEIEGEYNINSICIQCRDEYIKQPHHKYSSNIKDYSKHLGFCDVGCMDEYELNNYKIMAKKRRTALINSIKRFNIIYNNNNNNN